MYLWILQIDIVGQAIDCPRSSVPIRVGDVLFLNLAELLASPSPPHHRTKVPSSATNWPIRANLVWLYMRCNCDAQRESCSAWNERINVCKLVMRGKWFSAYYACQVDLGLTISNIVRVYSDSSEMCLQTCRLRSRNT